MLTLASAAAKELSEEERQLEERITAALKALPLWSDVLQYKVRAFSQVIIIISIGIVTQRDGDITHELTKYTHS